MEENGCYSNELIQAISQRYIKETTAETRSQEEITRLVNDNANIFVAVTTGALLGAVLCVYLPGRLLIQLKDRKEVSNMFSAGPGLGTAAALRGAIAGGIVGHDAAKGSETVERP